jgi:peptidoglycan/xylan/chitin deacetylase (PgdA/CDA1 family)
MPGCQVCGPGPRPEVLLNSATKLLIKSALMRSQLTNVASLATGTRVAVVRYHAVVDDPERYADSIGSGIIHPTDTFREHMEILAREYNPITLEDLRLFIAGEKDVPRRSVVVTFDDGYADNREIAAPILEQFGISGVFYVGVGAIDDKAVPWFCRLRYAFSVSKKETIFDFREGRQRPFKEPADRYAAFLSASQRCACLTRSKQDDALCETERELAVCPLQPKDCRMMTWDQVRELRQRGHAVGSHTVTHPNLAKVSPEEVQYELSESKRRLEEVLGETVIHFSYPSPILQPHYTEETRKVSAQIGYKIAFTCTSGSVQVKDEPLVTRRISAPRDKTEFRWNLELAFLGATP